MIRLLLCVLFVLPVFASVPDYSVPKESYLTFDDFLLERQSKSKSTFLDSKSIPSDWINLRFSAPLIGRYQIDGKSVVSVSRFVGSIGSELANINRWRRQLDLPPLTQISSSDIQRYQINHVLVKEINIQSSATQVRIYWLTRGNTHYFIKVDPFLPQISESVLYILESQPWPE